MLVLGVVLLLGYRLLLPNELARLGLRTAQSAGFGVNLAFARSTEYFAPDSSTEPLLHLWSLGVEEQFYVGWPLLIWLALRLRVRFLPVILFAGTFSLVWMNHKVPGEEASAFFLVQDRLWELLAGALAALLAADPRAARALARPWVANLQSLAGAGLVAAGLAMGGGPRPYPNLMALLPVVGAALLVCSDQRALLHRGLLSTRPLVAIGLISYPLYLWHWPLLTYAQLAASTAPTPLVRGALLGLSVLLAWATYRWVETPVRRGGRASLKAGAAASAMALLALAGLWAVRERGFPGRFPPEVQKIAQGDFRNPDAPWRTGTYFLINTAVDPWFPSDPREVTPGKPILFLWGDSHAAALYPGLSRRFGGTLSIVQRTIANCPPFLDPPGEESSANAKDNAMILQMVSRMRPPLVMLHGNWYRFGWTRLKDTVKSLRDLHVPRIIVVGPVPQWRGSLPQQLCNFARTHRGQPLPSVLTSGFLPEVRDVDRQMRAYAESAGLEYISPCDLLAEDGGFRVMSDASVESLFAWDNAHLSVAGSLYLVARFPALDAGR